MAGTAPPVDRPADYDLGRLADAEIREVVRLVKLVGDTPNVTYVLAFDEGGEGQGRTRCSPALSASSA